MLGRPLVSSPSRRASSRRPAANETPVLDLVVKLRRPGALYAPFLIIAGPRDDAAAKLPAEAPIFGQAKITADLIHPPGILFLSDLPSHHRWLETGQPIARVVGPVALNPNPNAKPSLNL